MKALIFESRVVQVEETDFPVAPALKWIDLTEMTPQPEPGWSYDETSGAFAPPVVEIEPAPDPDPQAELDIALEAAFAKIDAASSFAELKPGLAELKAALMGTAGRKGRVAGALA